MTKNIFLHRQDDQEWQECPQNGVLVEIESLDDIFSILTSHMIPFWNH